MQASYETLRVATISTYMDVNVTMS
jgi:hypothetical protein